MCEKYASICILPLFLNTLAFFIKDKNYDLFLINDIFLTKNNFKDKVKMIINFKKKKIRSKWSLIF